MRHFEPRCLERDLERRFLGHLREFVRFERRIEWRIELGERRDLDEQRFPEWRLDE
jgi:hypothetical protein